MTSTLALSLYLDHVMTSLLNKIDFLNSEFELTSEVINVEVRVAANRGRFLASSTSSSVHRQLNHSRLSTV